MSLILIILLAIFFGYSLILVLANNREVEVNLLFAQVPSTNLGLVLILTIALGVIIGILVSLLLFKVFQNKLEIRRLHRFLLFNWFLPHLRLVIAFNQHGIYSLRCRPHGSKTAF